MTTWSAADVPAQTGRTVLVTGATGGLGLETATVLAGAGARVLVAGRSVERTAHAVSKVAATATGPPPEPVHLDLADLASVRAAARGVASGVEALDVLVNNAGVMHTPPRRTVDGFELQIGTNHLGHFALTGLLRPLLRAAVRPRVVTVASGAHRAGRIDLDDLTWQQRRYDGWAAYAQSKLANLLFTLELAHRAAASGWDLLAVAAHPGWAATGLQAAGPRMSGSRVGVWLSGLGNALLAQSAAQGALPLLYAATMADVRSGEYFGPQHLGGWRGAPGRSGRSAAASDEAVAAALWELSERLTGVAFGLPDRA